VRRRLDLRGGDVRRTVNADPLRPVSAFRHLIAIFILGRLFLGVDTTFAWASGAPDCLLLDSWNVRLIPHYSIAVWFVLGHIAAGLRNVFIGHGIPLIVANRLAWASCAAGFAVSFVITIAQLNVRS
jgi:hypothetical protein